MFKCYSVFTSNAYKLLIWFFYPISAVLGILTILTGGFGVLFDRGFNYSAALFFLSNGILFVETVSDYFMFSGINSKSSNHIELLKCSNEGKKIYTKALIGDLIRKFLTIVLLNIINPLLGVICFNNSFSPSEDIPMIIVYALIVYIIVCICVFLGRFTTIIWDNIAYAYAGTMVIAFSSYSLGNFNIIITIAIILLLLISAIFSTFSIWFAINKMEDSYYDK